MAPLQEIQEIWPFPAAWLDSTDCGVCHALPEVRILQSSVAWGLSSGELCRGDLQGDLALPEMQAEFLRPMAVRF